MNTVPVSLFGRVGWRLMPFVLPLVLLGAYAYAAASGNPYFPSIGQVWSAGTHTWLGHGFSQNVVPSLTNLAIGYVVGLLAGVLGGLLLGRSRTVREMVWPIISFLLTLPPVILLPLMLLALGVGPIVQRSVIAFAVAILTIVNTTDGVRNIDPMLNDVSKSFGVGGWRRLLFVTLPAAAPHILASARIGVSVGLLLMVVGEMLGAAHGIGATILLAQQDFDYATLWSGVVLLALLGIILNFAFVALEQRASHSLGLDTVKSS